MFFMDVNLSLVTLSVLPVLIYGTFLFRKKVRESLQGCKTSSCKVEFLYAGTYYRNECCPDLQKRKR